MLIVVPPASPRSMVCGFSVCAVVMIVGSSRRAMAAFWVALILRV